MSRLEFFVALAIAAAATTALDVVLAQPAKPAPSFDHNSINIIMPFDDMNTDSANPVDQAGCAPRTSFGI